MKKIFLKVCGMRDEANIAALTGLQPGFIGFIFHEISPRYCEKVPKVPVPESIRKTGVFVNKSEEYIAGKKKDFHLDYIQLHGSESPDFCREIQQSVAPVIKAFNLHDDFDFDSLRPYEKTCAFFLFDASGQLSGGNGITFNWQILKQYRGTTPFLLSGGIDESMADAIRNINHPAFYGVDINSRFETLPGIKDINKIKRFKNELQS
ncbi:Phosphoribosylanthranilate isomerase [hydrothermal vent metagenome]|uniref:phosphoribosylanthranilate isomerase n=1 Tax=hydrothermal vent metagenome TaxID=652676 RepID=A0A3B0UVB0_9ZZZZ